MYIDASAQRAGIDVTQSRTPEEAHTSLPEEGERFNSIQGPPGTGKTTVIGQIAVHNLKMGRKFLAVAETRFAVQVVVAAITKAAETARL